ncbi:hypothetical protein Bca52824_006418 [Brassica carinata]|uniref:Uncharacterized protein n=1 Tax=Brassica carinata TaxID=52824 RepID=A0A8X7W796_BRACI|nr:hypothetical protein Bca52824_006418 [Brassica carinata]
MNWMFSADQGLLKKVQRLELELEDLHNAQNHSQKRSISIDGVTSTSIDSHNGRRSIHYSIRSRRSFDSQGFARQWMDEHSTYPRGHCRRPTLSQWIPQPIPATTPRTRPPLSALEEDTTTKPKEVEDNHLNRKDPYFQRNRSIQSVASIDKCPEFEREPSIWSSKILLGAEMSMGSIETRKILLEE